MLPPRCSQPPCMNMAVKSVGHWPAGSAAKRDGTNAHFWMKASPSLQLEQEHGHVDRDQDHRHDRPGPARAVIVADWKHGYLPAPILLRERSHAARDGPETT